MHSLDQIVLEQLTRWLRAGQHAWLCTIVATYGSSPRPAGSLFACNTEGVTAGSLSGGCIEEELLARLLAGELQTMQVLEYGVSAEENERLGLPCGGRLEILLEPLATTDLDYIEALLAAVSERRYLTRQVDLSDGQVQLRPARGYAPLGFSGNRLTQTFGPRYRMLLVGAGALSKTLSELASAMDYQVMVCDPRAEVLERWDGVALRRIPGMPDDAVREFAADRDCIVLTLTHDPRIDDMALMEALQHDLFYVGALGSPRTTEARIKRLRELDMDEEQLARLHAPVGLPIGSKTPMEISIAILAELTQLRSRRRLAALS